MPSAPENGTEPMGEMIVDRTVPLGPGDERGGAPMGPRGATLRMDQLQAAFGAGLPPPSSNRGDEGLTEEERFQRTAARLAREVRELSPARGPATIPPVSGAARAKKAKPSGGTGAKIAGMLVGIVLVLSAFGLALFVMNRMGVFGGAR